METARNLLNLFRSDWNYKEFIESDWNCKEFVEFIQIWLSLMRRCAPARFLRVPYLLWRIIHHKRYLMILICIIVIQSNTTPFIESIRSQILILSLSDLIYDVICIRSASDYRKFTFSAKRKFIYIPGLESKTNPGLIPDILANLPRYPGLIPDLFCFLIREYK